jgi:hypothetical protein
MLAGAPLLTFHPRDGRSPTKRALLDFLSKNLPRRQISDDVHLRREPAAYRDQQALEDRTAPLFRRRQRR